MRRVGALPDRTDDIDRDGADRCRTGEDGGSAPSPQNLKKKKGTPGMINLLAADGGYQAFRLGGTDKTWLYICLAAGIVGIVSGLLLARNVLAADQGTLKMKEIAKAIQEGAEAFLARQFRAIVMIIIPLAILIFFTATKVTHVVNGHTVVALSFGSAGAFREIGRAHV